MSIQPPYRIDTPRLVIRAWAPEDAEQLKRAQDESREHLLAHMLWAKTIPLESVDDVIEKIRGWRAEMDEGENSMFGAFDRKSGAIVGGTGLHPWTSPGGIEIGYWVHPAWTKQGIATEMTGALTRVAFEVLKVRFIEIKCAKSNVASAAVPPKLGFIHEATLRRRLTLPDGSIEDALLFSMLPRDYEASAAKKIETTAYDAAGRKIACGHDQP